MKDTFALCIILWRLTSGMLKGILVVVWVRYPRALKPAFVRALLGTARARQLRQSASGENIFWMSAGTPFRCWKYSTCPSTFFDSRDVRYQSPDSWPRLRFGLWPAEVGGTTCFVRVLRATLIVRSLLTLVKSDLVWPRFAYWANYDCGMNGNRNSVLCIHI